MLIFLQNINIFLYKTMLVLLKIYSYIKNGYKYLYKMLLKQRLYLTVLKSLRSQRSGQRKCFYIRIIFTTFGQYRHIKNFNLSSINCTYRIGIPGLNFKSQISGFLKFGTDWNLHLYIL